MGFQTIAKLFSLFLFSPLEINDRIVKQVQFIGLVLIFRLFWGVPRVCFKFIRRTKSEEKVPHCWNGALTRGVRTQLTISNPHL